MHALRQLLTRPRIGSRIAAAALTIVGLVPVLASLPKVAVVACFDVGHPLYQWVPAAPFSGTAHCLSAPAPAVTWTLMIAATLVVQLLALPLLLGVGAVLVRALRHLAHTARTALALALAGVSEVLVPARRPIPVYLPVRSGDADWSRANLRRGPPDCR